MKVERIASPRKRKCSIDSNAHNQRFVEVQDVQRKLGQVRQALNCQPLQQDQVFPLLTELSEQQATNCFR